MKDKTDRFLESLMWTFVLLYVPIGIVLIVGSAIYSAFN